MVEKGKKKGPPLPVSASKKGELSQKRVTALNPQEAASNSAGCDSSGKIFDGYTSSVLAMMKTGPVS